MIVLDASAAVDWLLQTSAGQRIEQRIYSHNESLHTPHLFDLEVTQVLRRLVREGAITAHRADDAIPRFAGSLDHSLSPFRAAVPDLATPSQFFCI